MQKLNSLLAHMTAAIPEVARTPDMISISAVDGALAARIGETLNFEYRYRAQILLFDFPASPDQVFFPLLVWIAQYQPEILLNHDRGVKDISFEVEMLDIGACDIAIHLPLTDCVSALPRSDGSGYDLSPIPELDPASLDGLPGFEMPSGLHLLRQIYGNSDFIVGYPDP